MNVSLAFFLASYQVHEKTILLPLLPAALLFPIAPLLSAWFSLFSCWTMWPLLAKDGLIAPAVCLCGIYACLAWPSVDEVADGDARLVASVLRRVGLQRGLVGDDGSASSGTTAGVGDATKGAAASATVNPTGGPHRRLARILQALAVFSLCTGAALTAAAFLLPAPASLPDLFPYLSAVLGAGQLLVLLACGTAMQAVV